jgi:hypothetical protein
MKNYLIREYYPWIQANCPFFTDHGELHVASVIQTASQLLGTHLENRIASELSSLDLFLILSSILWHDVGNVFGRSGHAKRVGEMTAEVKTLGFPNPSVQRLVNEISIAHSGEDGLEKPRLREDCATPHKTYTAYPSALAGIVRFSDEVSENQARISRAVMEKVPTHNRIFWEYASCVTASLPDPARQLVRITVTVPQESAVQSFAIHDEHADQCQRAYAIRTGKKDITLIEYIVCRLEKMNNERAYCAPRFGRYASIRELEVVLTLTKDNARIDAYDEQMTLGDGGLKQADYPVIELFSDFFAKHPKWLPEKIQEATA